MKGQFFVSVFLFVAFSTLFWLCCALRSWPLSSTETIYFNRNIISLPFRNGLLNHFTNDLIEKLNEPKRNDEHANQRWLFTNGYKLLWENVSSCIASFGFLHFFFHSIYFGIRTFSMDDKYLLVIFGVDDRFLMYLGSLSHK